MCQFSQYDLKRLEQYTRNMADYHLITDLLPTCEGVLQDFTESLQQKTEKYPHKFEFKVSTISVHSCWCKISVIVCCTCLLCCGCVAAVAKLYFTGAVAFKLDQLQSAILLGLGLQHKTVETLHVSIL